ncbi:hypothetical protein MLD38_034646 [Melastoma candidum]|uniref:Uncharacterized protein n=1 Tax=Melastoma candidum TaxID=119954 RepID=A0ACB9MBY1_9MYRT|nr:hypothetical protein MLD38_034646 [Melastoma candidum]
MDEEEIDAAEFIEEAESVEQKYGKCLEKKLVSGLFKKSHPVMMMQMMISLLIGGLNMSESIEIAVQPSTCCADCSFPLPGKECLALVRLLNSRAASFIGPQKKLFDKHQANSLDPKRSSSTNTKPTTLHLCTGIELLVLCVERKRKSIPASHIS